MFVQGLGRKIDVGGRGISRNLHFCNSQSLRPGAVMTLKGDSLRDTPDNRSLKYTTESVSTFSSLSRIARGVVEVPLQ